MTRVGVKWEKGVIRWDVMTSDDEWLRVMTVGAEEPAGAARRATSVGPHLGDDEELDRLPLADAAQPKRALGEVTEDHVLAERHSTTSI